MNIRDPKGRAKTVRTVTTTPRRRTTSDEAQEAKRKLEALFGDSRGASTAAPEAGSSPARSPRNGNGPVRRTPSGKVFSSPRKSTGRTPSEYRLRLERLRIAREPDEITTAIDAFLEHHQLPDEVDVLFKALQHPDEKVLREAMGQLSALLMQGRLNGTLMLADRLKELDGRVKEDATKSYIQGLRGQLKSFAGSNG